MNIVTSVNFLDQSKLRDIPELLESYYVSPDYWHTFVWLTCNGESAVSFSSREECVAPLFDVPGLVINTDPDRPVEWIQLEKPFHVGSIEVLWRNEWIVKGASGPTLGSDPHTHHRGPLDDNPQNAVAAARSLSGLLLSSNDRQQMLICCSVEAPLNVEIAVRDAEVTELLSYHSIKPLPAEC